MRVLSIDGGGEFGLIVAKLFAEYSPYAAFDAFGGTSIGAAIAAYYACGFDASKLPDLMREAFPGIFHAPWYRNLNACCSKYPNEALKSFLDRVFGDKTLGTVNKPLFLVAFNMAKSRIKVYSSVGGQDANVRIQDAVLDSVSAPTYFPPTPKVDGGLCANNPSVVTIAGLTKSLGIDMKDISLFSVGTGYFTNTDIDMSGALNWGVLQWAKPLIKSMLMASVTTFEFIANELPLKQYVRWNKVALEPDWTMDNAPLKDLEAQASLYQADFDSVLNSFLNPTDMQGA